MLLEFRMLCVFDLTDAVASIRCLSSLLIDALKMFASSISSFILMKYMPFLMKSFREDWYWKQTSAKSSHRFKQCLELEKLPSIPTILFWQVDQLQHYKWGDWEEQQDFNGAMQLPM